jgi:hypothetical protein
MQASGTAGCRLRARRRRRIGGEQSALAFLNLREEELLQHFIRQPERGRFFQRVLS